MVGATTDVAVDPPDGHDEILPALSRSLTPGRAARPGIANDSSWFGAGIHTAPARGMLARSSLLALAVALGACGPTITLTDDVDLTWDFGPTLQRFKDDLHTPYIKGTTVKLYVDSDDDSPDFSGWSIVSSDPSIFKVEDATFNGASLVARGVAVGEGVANLTVRDAGGHVVGHGDAEVLIPDRIQLEAHGLLILGRDDEAMVDDARIVENGTATYLVRYFREARELRGNGVLTVAPTAGLTATPRTSFLFEDREWIERADAGRRGSSRWSRSPPPTWPT